MISAVVSARRAGLDRIKPRFPSRFANRLPIFGASRLPRSLNGRSLSGNAVSSQLDFAWRMRNSVFMAVCIESLIRFDCVTESHNVGDDGCGPVLLSGAVDLTFKSKSRLEAENAALRHQLIVLQRKVRGRVHLTNSDR